MSCSGSLPSAQARPVSALLSWTLVVGLGSPTPQTGTAKENSRDGVGSFLKWHSGVAGTVGIAEPSQGLATG